MTLYWENYASDKPPEENIHPTPTGLTSKGTKSPGMYWENYGPKTPTTEVPVDETEADIFRRIIARDRAVEPPPPPSEDPVDAAITAARNMGVGVIRGFEEYLPEFVGKPLKFLGAEETGKSIEDWGKANFPDYRTEEEKQSMFSQAGEMMPASSLVPMAVGVAGKAMIGAGTALMLVPGGQVPGVVMAGTGWVLNVVPTINAVLYGLNQAEQTKESAIARGMDPGIAPYITGTIEAVGEWFGTWALMRYLGRFAPALALSKASAKDLLKPTIKNFARELAVRTLPTEVLTEVGQQFGEAGVEKLYGIRPDAKPIEEAMSVIGPTAIMTLMSAGAGHSYQHFEAHTTAKDLQDQNASIKDRREASMRVGAAIASNEEDPKKPMANLWLHYSGWHIENKLPINMDQNIMGLINEAKTNLTDESGATPSAARDTLTGGDPGVTPLSMLGSREGRNVALQGLRDMGFNDKEIVAMQKIEAGESIADEFTPEELTNLQGKMVEARAEGPISDIQSLGRVETGGEVGKGLGGAKTGAVGAKTTPPVGKVTPVVKGTFKEFVESKGETWPVKHTEPRWQALKDEYDGKVTATDEYVYHGTSGNRGVDIQNRGLLTGKEAGNTEAGDIYFSDKSYAETYANRKQGSLGGAILRVRKTEDIIPDLEHGKGDYKSSKSVSPENIEVMVGDKWVPIKNYDFIQKKIITPPAKIESPVSAQPVTEKVAPAKEAWEGFTPNEYGYQVREVKGLKEGYFVAQQSPERFDIIESKAGRTKAIVSAIKDKWQFRGEVPTVGKDKTQFMQKGKTFDTPQEAILEYNKYKDIIDSPEQYPLSIYKEYGNESTHRNAVVNAINQNKPVPPEVLKDYPDLVKPIKAEGKALEKQQVADLKAQGFKVKTVKEARVKRETSTPQNLVTTIIKKGGIKFGKDYQTKYLRQYPDLERVSNQRKGKSPDDLAFILNNEGFRMPNGKGIESGDDLIELLKTGEGRKVYSPEWSEQLIDNDVERQARDYYAYKYDEYIDTIKEAENAGNNAAKIEKSLEREVTSEVALEEGATAEEMAAGIAEEAELDRLAAADKESTPSLAALAEKAKTGPLKKKALPALTPAGMQRANFDQLNLEGKPEPVFNEALPKPEVKPGTQGYLLENVLGKEVGGMKEGIKEWQDIPDLDAQIRIIKEPKKKGEEWVVEIGVQESLGEQGGDILTRFYKTKPSLDEIKSDVLEHYRDQKVEINKEVAMGITAKSGRDEIIETAIDKVLSKKPILKTADKQVYEDAKAEFNKMISNTTPKEIEKARSGFGIAAARFARKYTNPKENQELYNEIYNIYYNYFNNLKMPSPLPGIKGQGKAALVGMKESEISAKGIEKDANLYTDPTRAQELLNSLAEGELILRSGKNVLGKKMTVPERQSVQKSIDNTKTKLEALKLSVPSDTTLLRATGPRFSRITTEGQDVDPERLRIMTGAIHRVLSQILPKEALERVRVELKPAVQLEGKNLAKSREQYGGTIDPEKVLGSVTFQNMNAAIEMAYNFDAADVVDTTYHETFHVAARWLLSPKEYQTLMKAYDNNEEKAAEKFSELAHTWRTEGFRHDQPVIEKIIDRLCRIFDRVRNALRGHGFRTADDIFEGLYGGKYKTAETNLSTLAPTVYQRLTQDMKRGDFGNMPEAVDSITGWLTDQGMNPAEVKWRGIESWLKDNADGDGNINRGALSDFILNSEIKVPDKFENSELQTLLRQVNETQIKHDDILSDTVKERMEGARGIESASAVDKIAEFARNFKKDIEHFPFLEEIEDLGLRARMKDVLRTFQSVPEWSQGMVINKMIGWMRPLSKDGFQVFRMNIILSDLVKDLDRGILKQGEGSWPAETPGPFGFGSEAEIRDAYNRYKDLSDKNPEIKTALDTRRAFQKTLRDELVKYRLLSKEVLNYDEYFHHQVLEYQLAKQGLGASSKDLRTHWRPWMTKRQGSIKDYNTEYIEAEYVALVQQLVQVETAKTLDRIQKEADITTALKAQAKTTNTRNLSKKLITEGKLKEGEDPFKPFKQKMAIGMSKLQKLAEDGQFQNVPSAFDDVIDSLATGEEGDTSHFFNFLSYLMEHKGEDGGDLPGAISAATIMKAVQERNAFMKDTLGDDFVHYLSLMPESYQTWIPDPKKGWFWANSITDSVLQKVMTGEKEINDVDVRKVLAKGRNQVWVIPKGLAKQMDNFKDTKTGHIGEQLAQRTMAYWKRYILLNPFSVVRYNINNFSGDLDAAFAYSHHIVAPGRMLQSAKDLWGWMNRKDIDTKLQEFLDDAQRRGVLQSGWAAQEVSDIAGVLSADRIVKNLILEENPVFTFDKLPAHLKEGSNKYWDFVKHVTTWRENIIRLSAYRYFLEQLEGGKQMYGATKRRWEIDALSDNDKRETAAKMSRELLGDYGNISAHGEYIRKSIVPFAAWLEINAPRYVYMLRNAQHEEESPGVAARVTLTLGKKAVGKTFKWGVRAAAFYALVSMWNAIFFPDEEEELGETGRDQMHLILGRNADGGIRTIRLQGALSDALSFFGLQDAPKDYREMVEGKRSIWDELADVPKAIFDRAIQGLRPDVKVLGEALSGKSFYPEATRPTPIYDTLEHVLRTYKLDIPYRYIAGKPMRGPTWKEHFVEDLKKMFVYTADPGEQSYYTSRKLVFDWLETQGKERPSSTPTKKGKVLYYYRQALKFGDLEAAQRYLKKYYEFPDAKRESLRQALKTQHPLASIAKKDRYKFKQTLSEKDRATFDRAIEWYKKTYGNIDISRPEEE